MFLKLTLIKFTINQDLNTFAFTNTEPKKVILSIEWDKQVHENIVQTEERRSCKYW